MRRKPLRFKIVLPLLIILIGGLLALASARAVELVSYNQKFETLDNELQSKGQVLSDKMARQSFVTTGKDDQVINAESTLIADIYDGRVVVVNSALKVIYDTFSLANGKYSIAPEVISCFNGEAISRHNKEEGYLIKTFPIYSVGDSKEIAGVLLLTASTEDVDLLTEKLHSSSNLIILVLLLILIPAAVLLSILLLKPFDKLRDSLKRVANGNLNDTIDAGEYKITDEIASAINSTIGRLRTMDESRDEFVANVSHELKTPITSMQVLADSLNSMGEVPNELYQEFMQDISDEINRESSIIDDLLEMVKMDDKEASLKLAPVDINNLIKTLLKRLRPLADKKQVELIFESVRDVTVEGDETKLSLALMNIIENSIKYNVEGGSVRVYLDADHQNCYIDVVDTGIGLSDDYKELIFERFYRVDKARSRESGGTGLGLAITKKIILLHRGEISVESEEGTGSDFKIKLPLKFIKYTTDTVRPKKHFSMGDMVRSVTREQNEK